MIKHNGYADHIKQFINTTKIPTVMAEKVIDINGERYKNGDEVMFSVLKGRGQCRGIFRGRYDHERYNIQDVDNNWKMPGGSNYCFTLLPNDFNKLKP